MDATLAPTRTAAIARAFGAAAAGYDRAATLQRQVAATLAHRIAALPLTPAPRVLELGCGTGLLTGRLLQTLSPSCYVATDIAPAMLQACRSRHSAPALLHAVMDAQVPCLAAPGFDLICASLVAQWFHDAPGALARLHGLLRRGGVLAIATLGPASLAAWRHAHLAEGVEPATLALPPATRLAAAWPGASTFTAHTVTIRHASAMHFVRSLRDLGAGTPHPGHTPAGPATLRRILARFDAAGAEAVYEVVVGVMSRA